MAFEGKDVDPEKKTGFTFRGKEIILSKTRGRPFSGKMINGKYPENKRIEAVTIFAATGSYEQVEQLSGVPKGTFRGWLKQEWCNELLNEIRNENDQAIDAKFTEILEKTIAAIADRLLLGDFVLDRHGELVRKPVSMRDAVGAMMITVDKRNLLRGRPTSRSETSSVEQKLEKLATHFEKLAQKTKETPKITPSETPKDASPALQDEPQSTASGIPLPSPLLDTPEVSKAI